MPTYRVFLGAPTKDDIFQETGFQWHTISSQPNVYPNLPFPPATMDAAHHRISRIYQNIIFSGEDDEEDHFELIGQEDNASLLHDQTTLLTWPPTQPPNLDNSKHGSEIASHSIITTSPSFLLNDSRMTQANSQSLFTQSEDETDESQSFNYSDASSIARFPTFHFNLHALTLLSTLSVPVSGNNHSGFYVKPPDPPGQRHDTGMVSGVVKVNVLLAVLEIEGPDVVKIKKGRDAGNEVGVLKMILGDEEGNVCKLTAWREVAELWGSATGAKRGDILLIENVTTTSERRVSPTLTASSNFKSSMVICYRTMPTTREDTRLRPDLRLAVSDSSVKKVAKMVRWFEEMAGLAQHST